MITSRGDFTRPHLLGARRGSAPRRGALALERVERGVGEQHAVGPAARRRCRAHPRRRPSRRAGCGTTSRRRRRRSARRSTTSTLPVELERAEQLDGPLRLGLVEGDLGHDGELAAREGVGERRAERALAASSCSRASSGRGGCGPCATPPPTHCGERIEPWRARPVPFWRHGFLPPPRTSPRVFVECVPARSPARPGDHHLVHQRHAHGRLEDVGARGRASRPSCPAASRMSIVAIVRHPSSPAP